MTGYNYQESAWPLKDKLALGLVIGAHLLALWQFTRVVHPMAIAEAVPLEVSLVIPQDEPPPPEPKPPPPRIQPKTPPPKDIPKPAKELPPVITETPVAKPIASPPPAPPAPPAPTPPVAAKPISGSYLQIKVDCKPDYPRRAKREGIEGKVTLLITVNEHGIPEKVEVSKTSGNFELDNAARAAAGRCVFVPQTVNGTPVKGQGLRDIVFKLSEG